MYLRLLVIGINAAGPLVQTRLVVPVGTNVVLTPLRQDPLTLGEVARLTGGNGTVWITRPEWVDWLMSTLNNSFTIEGIGSGDKGCWSTP